MENYGKLLVMDIHNCDVETFNRYSIESFCAELCRLIEMERVRLDFWADEDTPDIKVEPHLAGISACQFIKTSSITIHAMRSAEKIYVDLFSCKDFNEEVAENYTEAFFGGRIFSSQVIDRV